MSNKEVWTSEEDAIADINSLSEFGHGPGFEINSMNWLLADTNSVREADKSELGLDSEIISVAERRLITAAEMDAVQQEVFSDFKKANVVIEQEFNGSMLPKSHHRDLKQLLFKKAGTSKTTEECQKTQDAFNIKTKTRSQEQED